MANLCAKLPIYEVDEGELDLTHLNQETRVARRPANRKLFRTLAIFNHICLN